METINEKTTAILTLTFTDEDGDAVTPSAGTYQIDDVESNTNITAKTDFTPIASTYDLEITPNENRTLDSTKNYELRRVTVTMTYSGAKSASAEYDYKVKNLNYIT